MLDSIFIAMSGLDGYEKGLRTISNDTANLNTPGYKGASLQFADAFHAASDFSNASGEPSGYGLTTLGTRLDFKQGISHDRPPPPRPHPRPQTTT